MNTWLEISEGGAPLIISFPHTGTAIPEDIQGRLISPWRARKDTDWWVDRLYDFAGELGVTTIRTSVSRTVIDVNRDPSGASLYPGQATTDLCPLTTFDGEALYRRGCEPDTHEIATRRERFFEPYHAALAAQIQRLKANHATVVLYDAHSIRSRVPRLFEGLLPQFNLGTNNGSTCQPELQAQIEAACKRAAFSHVTNGRFKGGWTTRHYGQPAQGVQAVQMELACRGYMHEPETALTEENWPSPLDAGRAAPLRLVLREMLSICREQLP